MVFIFRFFYHFLNQYYSLKLFTSDEINTVNWAYRSTFSPTQREPVTLWEGKESVTSRPEMLQNLWKQDRRYVESNAVQNTVEETVVNIRVVPCIPNAIVNRRVQEMESNSSEWWTGKWGSTLFLCPCHPHSLLFGPTVGNPQMFCFTRCPHIPSGNSS